MDCKENCLHCTDKCNTKSNTNQHGNCELKDEEIIKALECCENIKDSTCKHCCFYRDSQCVANMAKNALDLINRKTAEIEKNENIIRLADKAIETQNKEIERLKKQLDAAEYCIREVDVALYHGSYNDYCGELIEKYNNLVKETVGD